jgi:hypothetical protein
VSALSLRPGYQQQVLGGVKRRKWPCRPLRITRNRRGVRLGWVRIYLVPIKPHACAAARRTGMGGCSEPEELQALLVVHASTRFATPQLGSHWATIHTSETAKAADMCSTL